MILPDHEIRDRNIFSPFTERSIANGMSYGLGPCGYDVRIAQTIWLWPFWGRLASIMEKISMPTDLRGEVYDKSTWARRFVHAQNTVIEPGWHGYLTIELTRHLPWPVRIKAGTPIAQIQFAQLKSPCERPYSGKYQGQMNRPTPAIYERTT